MRVWGVFCLLVLIIKTSNAITIHGTVFGANNEKLGYSNIFVKGTSNGTSANADGQYHFDLPPGNYEIVFQHLGYQQHVEQVNLQKDLELNITLEQIQYQIKDVVINGNEDPAISVIRKAIERRKYFLNVVESYSCDAYVKGMERILEAPDKILGRKINRTGVLTGPNNSGILYLSESQSKLYYKKPNKFHEVIYSSKVSGKSNGFTFNSAQDFFFNFYDRSITIPFIAQRPFISPLSETAFFYYNYKMLGAYWEGDKLINKISVTPKRKSDPCFTGVLSIVENNWNIHSLELYLTKDNGIQYVDTLKVTQYFIPIKDDIWLPSQQRYDAKAGFLGIKGDGYYLGIFKNYELNDFFGMKKPAVNTDSTKTKKKTEKQLKKLEQNAEQKIEKKIFTPEIIKIENEANKRDPIYWDSIRPIPLTAIESQDYEVKDSVQSIRESKPFKDSTDKKVNAPGPLSIIFGYTLRKQYKKIWVDFPSLFNLVNFNTMEGVVLQAKFGIRKEFNTQRSIYFGPAFRYGIHNKQFNSMAVLSYRNSQIHEESISLSGGRYVSQFGGGEPQTEFGNTWQTLVFKNNFMKMYEQYFVRLSYSRELANGFWGMIGVSYTERSPLTNTDTFAFFPKYKNYFTPNAVDIPDAEGQNVSRHNFLSVDVHFHITFGSKYVTRPDMRFHIESKYPDLSITYKAAIPINGFSDQNFQYLEAQLKGNIPMKLLGTMYYRFGGGGFPLNKAIDYPDYKSFYGNFLNLGGTDLLGFYLIQYYRNTTDQYFAEAHIEHHFGGFFFNKIPGIRKLKLDEVLGFHFLYTPVRKEYFQVNVGLANIFKIIRVDFVAGFEDQLIHQYGARVAIVLDFRR
jgi:hypothetical protein